MKQKSLASGSVLTLKQITKNYMQRIATAIIAATIAIASHTSYAANQSADPISEDDPPDIQMEVEQADPCSLSNVSCDEDQLSSDGVQDTQQHDEVRQVDARQAVTVAGGYTGSDSDGSRSVQLLIKQYAGEYGVNEETALRIAQCESNFNPYARNKHSTAKGIYQFLDGTWNGYCDGSVFEVESNIKCFMQLYPKYPSWWECK